MTERDDRVAARYFIEVGRTVDPTPEEERALFTQLYVARRAVAATTKRLRALCKHAVPGDAAGRAVRDGLRATRARWRTTIDRLEAVAPTGYVKFVVREARRWTHDPELLKELISVGNLGLLKAVRKYDVTYLVSTGEDTPPAPARFLTYAAWWINVFIQEYLAKADVAHVPGQVKKKNRRERRAEELLETRTGEHTTPGEALPSTSGTDVALLAAPEAAEVSQEDLLLRQMVDARLTRGERLVLGLSFGFFDTEPRTLAEITTWLHGLDGSVLPTDAVRVMKERGMKKLKTHLGRQGVHAAGELI